MLIRDLGSMDYPTVYQAMIDFTAARTPECVDELWCVQHPPVFTQGRNGKPEHLHDAGNIPVVEVDRGGQITYHGPGQLVIYVLIDLNRLGIGVRQLVTSLEQCIIKLLAEYKIDSVARQDAPGVYVNGAKVAALGLRISRGRSYHGLSLNVDMDLSPFKQINPCGYKGLEVTQLIELGINQPLAIICERLTDLLAQDLGYNTRQHAPLGALP